MNLQRIMLTLCLLGVGISHSAWGAPVAAKPSDDRMTSWVRQALVDDPRIDTAEITVSTANGIVTLAGRVRTLAAKQYADREAKKIHGVRAVINTLRVTPEARLDTDIAKDVRHRLSNSVSIKSQGLGVTVRDGVVSLTGTVASWAESQEAALLASEVPGVRSIANHLALAYPRTRSDMEIQRDAEAVLTRDVYLTGWPITVTVKNGVVTLAGEVGSAYQKEQAGDAMFSVVNVTGVNNHLAVKPWENRGTRKHLPAPTDAQLQVTLHDALAADQRLEPANIRVEVVLGKATLRGSVPSYHQKRLATRDAQDVVGIAWVTNLLAVRGQRRDDAAIQKDVTSQLATATSLGSTDMLRAEVHDGIVTLTGDVNNSLEKVHAADLVSRIPGVRNIVNNILVNWSSWETDAAVKRRIKEHLDADGETRWAAKQIHVAVNRGVVTLTGSVYFWSERQAAARIAQETAGVREVENQLAVTGFNYDWQHMG